VFDDFTSYIIIQENTYIAVQCLFTRLTLDDNATCDQWDIYNKVKNYITTQNIHSWDLCFWWWNNAEWV